MVIAEKTHQKIKLGNARERARRVVSIQSNSTEESSKLANKIVIESKQQEEKKLPLKKCVIPPEHTKWLKAPGTSRKHTLG